MSEGKSGDVRKGRLAGMVCPNEWDKVKILHTNGRAGLMSITWKKSGTAAALALGDRCLQGFMGVISFASV